MDDLRCFLEILTNVFLLHMVRKRGLVLRITEIFRLEQKDSFEPSGKAPHNLTRASLPTPPSISFPQILSSRQG